MSANMGGTEIMEPLELILKMQNQIERFPRFIFLITDGGVMYTELVLKLIKENIKSAKIFSLGIGNGASQELIKGAAQAGNGTYEFVV